jgi:putative hydrolase of the HAD superfamily
MSRVVVFDLDDTLYPEHQFVLSGFRAVGAWLERERGLSGFEATARSLFASGARGNIFDRALESLGHPASPELVQQLVKVYREHPPTLTLHADARRALDQFKGRHRLALITDGFLETQRNKVAALGLAPYMEALIFSDEHGRACWKPSPVPYRRCVEALGCTAADCTYVGDNPNKDFVTARSLGWKTVQILREGGEYSGIMPAEGYQADHLISSLDDLQTLIPS